VSRQPGIGAGAKFGVPPESCAAPTLGRFREFYRSVCRPDARKPLWASVPRRLCTKKETPGEAPGVEVGVALTQRPLSRELIGKQPE
jgi:hypothetical protein